MVENIPLDIAQIGQQETHMHHICTKNNQHPKQEVLEVKEIPLDSTWMDHQETLLDQLEWR